MESALVQDGPAAMRSRFSGDLPSPASRGAARFEEGSAACKENGAAFAAPSSLCRQRRRMSVIRLFLDGVGILAWLVLCLRLLAEEKGVTGR